jgi:hypothetical protein
MSENIRAITGRDQRRGGAPERWELAVRCGYCGARIADHVGVKAQERTTVERQALCRECPNGCGTTAELTWRAQRD